MSTDIKRRDDGYHPDTDKVWKMANDNGFEKANDVEYCKRLISDSLWALQLINFNIDQEIDQKNFIQALAKSGWSRRLSNDNACQLFFIVTDAGKKSKIDVLIWALMFMWLGPIYSDKAGLVPADIAISAYYTLLKHSSKFAQMFTAFVSRQQLEQMKSKELVIRLNEGRKDMTEKVSPMLFHRNMVLSNPTDRDFPHRLLLFTFDPDKWAIVEASEATRVRYRRRGATSSTGSDVTSLSAVLRAFNATPKTKFDTMSGEKYDGKPTITP